MKLAMNVKNFNLNRAQPYDPITPVARDISRDTTLLCFDEFQVNVFDSCLCRGVYISDSVNRTFGLLLHEDRMISFRLKYLSPYGRSGKPLHPRQGPTGCRLGSWGL